MIWYDNECRRNSAERFLGREDAVMGLPINCDINLEYYQRDLYAEMGFEEVPEICGGGAAAAKKTRKRYGGDAYGSLVCGISGPNPASYDKQTP